MNRKLFAIFCCSLAFTGSPIERVGAQSAPTPTPTASGGPSASADMPQGAPAPTQGAVPAGQAGSEQTSAGANVASTLPSEAAAIQELRTLQILQSATPSSSLTSQGQFLTLLDRAVPKKSIAPYPLASSGVGGPQSSAQLAATSVSYYAPAVRSLMDKGVLSGVAVQPPAPILREDAALLAVRDAYAERIVPGGARPRTPPPIDDLSDISPHAQNAVIEAIELGLISTYPDNKFHPKNALTYGQAAVIAVQLHHAAQANAGGEDIR